MMKRILTCLLILTLLCPGATVPAAAEETGIAYPVSMIRCGGSFVFAMDAEGTLWGWGDNTRGQLGMDEFRYIRVPAKAATGLNSADILDIAGGNENTLYLMKDGTVYTSGNGNHGTQGQGREQKNRVGSPIRVPGLTDIVAIDSGFGHNAALDSAGHVWTWGRNNCGQVGNGARTDQWDPVCLPLENIVQVACGGKFCLALDGSGRLWGWGQNSNGVLGPMKNKRKTVYVTEPAEITLLENVRIAQLAAGSDFAYALDDAGTVWAWGRNDYWQIGSSEAKGDSPDGIYQVEIPEPVSRVIGYNAHSMAITEKGNVYIWGSVSAGQMGTGKKTSKSLPVCCWDQGNVIDGSVGSLICAIVTSDGTNYTAGYNKYYQMGDGTNRSNYHWNHFGENADGTKR